MPEGHLGALFTPAGLALSAVAHLTEAGGITSGYIGFGVSDLCVFYCIPSISPEYSFSFYILN